jgi:protein N-terminal methyltransferase
VIAELHTQTLPRRVKRALDKPSLESPTHSYTQVMAMDTDAPFGNSSFSTTSSAPDASIDYTKGIEYWNSISSDVNGMLGGFPQTTRIDLIGSSAFLAKLRRGKAGAVGAKTQLPKLRRAADCGAGIGRITKGLLVEVADTVDVVEPVVKFTDELVKEFKSEEGKGRVGEVINLGLQDWTPAPGSYDLIWNQWCLGHLTDAQLVAYLRRCRDGLRNEEGQGAWIVVKENLSREARSQDIYDDEDSSVTRSDEKFRKLFQESGLKIVDTKLQTGFPKELFPVRMYALRPE